MHTREKPAEVLQAQTVGFIVESPVDYRSKEALFKRLGDIASLSGQAESLTLDSSGDVKISEAGTEGPTPSDETAHAALLKRDEYARFLREKGGAHNEAIRAEADMLAAYREFDPDVRALKSQLREMPRADEHPAYLGSGAGSHAFSLQKNGREYVVLALKHADPAAINIKLQGASRGRSVPHVEQVVAGSYEESTTVSERVPGRALDALSADDIGAISEEQLGTLVDTLKSTVEKGIRLDHKPGNFLYDPKEGFGLVDYTATDKPQVLAQVLQEAAMVLSQAGDWAYSDDTGSEPLSREEIQRHNAGLYAANLVTLKKFRTAIMDKMPADTGQTASRGIDEYIAEYQHYGQA